MFFCIRKRTSIKVQVFGRISDHLKVGILQSWRNVLRDIHVVDEMNAVEEESSMANVGNANPAKVLSGRRYVEILLLF